MDWQTLLCDDRIRSYKKQSSTDLRTEFEKDYHRIIGSASFRRLQDKTQVFPLDRSDFIRTRLTHSPGGFIPGQIPGTEHIGEHPYYYQG